MSYELVLIYGPDDKWHTNRIAVKNDRIDEVRNWLKALEIVFNDGKGCSFSFSIKPDCDAYSIFEASGTVYEFRLSEDVYDDNDGHLYMDEDDIFEECFAEVDFENDDVKSDVIEILSALISMASEYNSISEFLNAEKLNFDIEKTKELNGNVPKCYIETFDLGNLDRDLPQKSDL